MKQPRPRPHALTRLAAAGAGLAAGAYAVYVARAWLRYGHIVPPDELDADSQLDAFIPRYDIVERHHIRVNAPAEVTLAAAGDAALSSHPVIRGIFRAREMLLGSSPPPAGTPRGLLAEAEALGWVRLAEVFGREIVMGAVTRPWEADVVFRGVPPAAFRAFDEPGYVKIAWTLRADPDGPDASVFRTETRAVATDADARRRFRLYWSCLSPGIIIIRWVMLGPTKAAAERRARVQ